MIMYIKPRTKILLQTSVVIEDVHFFLLGIHFYPACHHESTVSTFQDFRRSRRVSLKERCSTKNAQFNHICKIVQYTSLDDERVLYYSI